MWTKVMVTRLRLVCTEQVKNSRDSSRKICRTCEGIVKQGFNSWPQNLEHLMVWLTVLENVLGVKFEFVGVVGRKKKCHTFWSSPCNVKLWDWQRRKMELSFWAENAWMAAMPNNSMTIRNAHLANTPWREYSWTIVIQGTESCWENLTILLWLVIHISHWRNIPDLGRFSTIQHPQRFQFEPQIRILSYVGVKSILSLSKLFLFTAFRFLLKLYLPYVNSRVFTWCNILVPA